jgi:mitochondrial chaperone BCS1
MASTFVNHTASHSPAGLGQTSPSGLPQIQLTILDALIPGYSVLADTFLRYAGIDVSYYVSLCAFAFALHAAWTYTVIPFKDYVLKSLSSTVVVDEYDDIYEHVLKWVREHTLMADLRAIRAESRGRFYDYEEDDVVEGDAESVSPLSHGSIFNFRQWSARLPPKYEPHSSSGYFWHKGYFYRISRDQKRVESEWSGIVREREYLLIQCLWRTTQPLKMLIDEARESYIGKQTTHTRIYRPQARDKQSEGNEWHCVSVRPSRPVSTVVLDDEPKAEILMDMNEFLHPKTATWYSNRGIPYRRGYLFHGPPGTGKSSMSFALAGVFGLNIYCLSLSEITLTEENLIVLLNTLPRRCIVLLEDIDSAGVSRPKPPGKDDDDKKADSKKDTATEKDGSKAAAVVVMTPNQPKKLVNAISISGLLNAIDGVASAEGRVLIMTTNYPEKLDDALVRPGRVDLKICFDLASKQQIKELFLRMYSADVADSKRKPQTIAEIMPNANLDSFRSGDDGDLDVAIEDKRAPSRPSSQGKMESSRPTTPIVATSTPNLALEKLADKFAAELPASTFSPAEIQGYLLTRKKGPRKAVADIAAWRDENLAKKSTKSGKVLSPNTTPKAAQESDDGVLVRPGSANSSTSGDSSGGKA